MVGIGRRSGLWIGIVVLAGLAGGPNGESPGHQFNVTVEGGVEIALTTGGPKYEGEIFEYEKVLEIRPDPDLPESYLYTPQELTMAEDGTIFVADSGNRRVVAFAPDGTYLRSYGREGEGPGEFFRPGALEVVDGVLWAYDYARHRTHAYSVDGEVLRTVTVPPAASSLIRDGFLWPLDDGRIVIFNLGLQREATHGDYRGEMRVIDEHGRLLAQADTPWLRRSERIRPADLGDPVGLTIQFSGFPWADFSREHGFYLMGGAEPEVLVYNLDGTLRRIFRIEAGPRSVSPADRAWAAARLNGYLQRALESDPSGSTTGVRRARVRLDNPRYAEPKHMWGRMYVDEIRQPLPRR